MKHFYFFIFASCFFFVQCAEFRDAFNGPPSSSRHAYSKKKKVKQQKSSSSSSSQIVIKTPTKKDTDFVNRSTIQTDYGYYYFIKQGDSLEEIAKQFKTSELDIAQINNLFDSNLYVGRRIFIPKNKARSEFIAKTEAYIETQREKQKHQPINFIWPMEQRRVTSRFGPRWGRMHSGLDIGGKVGSPIFAAADGRVIFANSFSGYGRLVVIKHRKGYFTAYAHTDKVFVKQGKKVKQGDRIATVGMTGNTTGPHLHFEIRKSIHAVDPLTVLPQ